MKTKLKATLQRDYYGKAWVITDDYGALLISYNTPVLRIYNDGTIQRRWSGWSATTMKHINDFLLQRGFSALSKKEWLALPMKCKEHTFRVFISNGFVTHAGTAMLTEAEAIEEAERLRAKNPRFDIWYE